MYVIRTSSNAVLFIVYIHLESKNQPTSVTVQIEKIIRYFLEHKKIGIFIIFQFIYVLIIPYNFL